MQGSAWVSLIQRIPEKLHESLVVMTTAGAEIMVQKILKCGDDVLIFRGRSVGSTDHARTVLLPFAQLNYLAFAKPILEADILAMFSTSGTTAPLPATSPAPATAAIPSPEPANGTLASPSQRQLDATTPVEPVEPAHVPIRSSGPPSKSILLARLRARLGKDPSP